MELSWNSWMLMTTVGLMLLLVAATPPNQRKLLMVPEGCPETCGDTQISYPFGIGNSSIDPQQPCFMGNGKFNLSCQSKSKLHVAQHNFNVTEINLEGWMVVSFYVSRFCHGDKEEANDPFFTDTSLTISSRANKFITVGCDSFGYLNSNYEGATYSTGCLTRCYTSNPDMQIEINSSNGRCAGLGCCQVDIPPRMKDIAIQVYEFPKTDADPLLRKRCSYSFIAKKDSYHFSVADLSNANLLSNKRFPMVVNWAVTNESCEEAKKTKQHYACKENSECEDNDKDIVGYRCKCQHGFEGNPYLGCKDIDECASKKHSCISSDYCQNGFGNHTCLCPKGQSGNATMGGGGCHRSDVRTKVVIGAGIGVIVLLVGILSLHLIYQKRKIIKLKEKYFKQNGGVTLLQQLSTRRQDSSSQTQTVQIFTENQLKEATNNFDQTKILGRGGFGTVFRGELADKRTVAIKKSKLIDATQINQFINEVVVLSQINHRNVVKLLGCCLETEVPLLVYEFVSNGTLTEFINTTATHGGNNANWKTLLRIATEVAGALSYLHSAASIPIIHRDVKSDNILLDENQTAKVSDFGASRFIPLDKTEVATMVQGTIGYLDPEYMQTSQLTEKSDVYSFGVVLVELLTAKKPFCFGRPEESRSLATHFLSCVRNDHLLQVIQDGIMNEGNEKEIKEVAILAAKCLRLRGEERPCMKEVAMELEGLMLMDKKSWINKDMSGDETCYLPREASSSIYETGGHSSSIGDTGGGEGYDSLKDHVLIALDDDGR